jgi:hypothetical protein
VLYVLNTVVANISIMEIDCIGSKVISSLYYVTYEVWQLSSRNARIYVASSSE